MKPKVYKHKDARGRIVGYGAELGAIVGKGATPALAVAECDQLTIAAIKRLDRGTAIGKWREHTYVVSPHVNGWEYWIDTFSQLGYSVSGSWDQREDCVDAALHHLAQNLWSRDTDDTAMIASLPVGPAKDMKGWIAWQRQMIAFEGQGYTQDQARQMIAQGTTVTS